MAFLSVNGNPIEKYPNATEMHTLMENLSEGKDSFIIAAKEVGNIFIQCCKTDGKFILQYNDGNALFQCRETSLNAGQIANVFQAFNANSNIWKSRLTWEEINLNSYPRPGQFPELLKWLTKNPIAILISISIVVLAGVLGFYHCIPFAK